MGFLSMFVDILRNFRVAFTAENCQKSSKVGNLTNTAKSLASVKLFVI